MFLPFRGIISKTEWMRREETNRNYVIRTKEARSWTPWGQLMKSMRMAGLGSYRGAHQETLKLFREMRLHVPEATSSRRGSAVPEPMFGLEAARTLTSRTLFAGSAGLRPGPKDVQLDQQLGAPARAAREILRPAPENTYGLLNSSRAEGLEWRGAQRTIWVCGPAKCRATSRTW